VSPEVVDRIVLVVALALCLVVGVLAAWVGRLEENLREVRRAVGTPTGQREKPLESTPEDPRPALPPGEKKLHRRPVSLASQAGVRARAESILRERHRAERIEHGGAA
jgi:hypothetical protein